MLKKGENDSAMLNKNSNQHHNSYIISKLPAGGNVINIIIAPNFHTILNINFCHIFFVRFSHLGHIASHSDSRFR